MAKQPWEYDALEDVARRVERMGYGEEREKHEAELAARYRKNAGKGKRKKQHRERQKNKPLMRELMRPFTQGRRLLRTPSDDQPMSRKEYELYLATDYWQDFVQRYREDPSTKHECFVCGSPDYELHHRTYARLGREEFADVVPLCRAHHDRVHKLVKAGKRLAEAHLYVRQRYLAEKASVAE